MVFLDLFCGVVLLIIILLTVIIGIPLVVGDYFLDLERRVFLKNNKSKYDKIKKDYLKKLEKYQHCEAVNDDIGEEYILVENNNLYVLKKLYNIEYYETKGLPTELETTISLSDIRYFSLEGGVSTQQLGGKTMIVLNDNHRTITIGSNFVYDLLLDYIPEKEYSNYIENKKEKGRKIK